MNLSAMNPDEALHVRHSRVYAVVVLLAMIAHTYIKWRLGTLPELLWGCNLASFCIIARLWFQSLQTVAVGFLWHVCIGDPAYLEEVIRSGHTGWTSVVVHGLPPLALALFIALVPISHYLTPAPLNINLAHDRLWFLKAQFPGNRSYRLVFSAGMLLLLLIGDTLLALILKRPPPASELNVRA